MKNKVLHILLAEDNPISSKLAQINIAKLGHSLDIAHNGKEAIELYRKKKYDVILMDIEMPEMGGVDATKIIRTIEKEENITRPVKIVAMTAHDNDQKRIFIESGMDAYCNKPYRRHELDDLLK
ncbi:MAG: response regulator [Bacteroidales bacterium]|nr:response regulator [Bacteroidales bacterium]